MQEIYELPILFTFEQVQQFGELTGDNGPIHSVDGIVQGGFIISMLPKWLTQIIKDNNLGRGSERNVSMLLDAKFRNKLQCNKLVKVSFAYGVARPTMSKLAWRVYDDDLEYCSGNWVIYKS